MRSSAAAPTTRKGPSSDSLSPGGNDHEARSRSTRRRGNRTDARRRACGGTGGHAADDSNDEDTGDGAPDADAASDANSGQSAVEAAHRRRQPVVQVPDGTDRAHAVHETRARS